MPSAVHSRVIKAMPMAKPAIKPQSAARRVGKRPCARSVLLAGLAQTDQGIEEEGSPHHRGRVRHVGARHEQDPGGSDAQQPGPQGDRPAEHTQPRHIDQGQGDAATESIDQPGHPGPQCGYKHEGIAGGILGEPAAIIGHDEAALEEFRLERLGDGGAQVGEYLALEDVGHLVHHMGYTIQNDERDYRGKHGACHKERQGHVAWLADMVLPAGRGRGRKWIGWLDGEGGCSGLAAPGEA